MSRYMMIRRLRGPAFLLLVGVLALLNQADILSWGKSWPFFLILAGMLVLAERAALASEGGYPPFPGVPQQGQPYPGQPYPGAPQPGAPDQKTATGVPTYPGQPTAFVAPEHKDSEGGQS
jgi:hypothetical protein